MDGITAAINLINSGGPLVLLVIAIWGGMKGWYVWGTTHDKELSEKDKVIEDKERTIAKLDKDLVYWREFALRTLTAGEKAIRLKSDDTIQ